MKNDEKLREQLSSAPVPDKLRPENIKIMLDKEAPKKKRSGISMAGRITAAAAACAVIGGTAAYTTNNGKINKKTDGNVIETTTSPGSPSSEKLPEKQELKKQVSYMSGATDYEEVYTLFKDAAKKAEKEYTRNRRKYAVYDEEADIAEEAVHEYGMETDGISAANGAGGPNEVPIIEREKKEEPATTAPVTTALSSEVTVTTLVTELTTTTAALTTTATTAATTSAVTTTTDADPEHSETYYQEQDVLEADIVKTDGKHIYYVCNPTEVYNPTGKANFLYPVLRVADVKDGRFTDSISVDIKCDPGNAEEFFRSSVSEMYIYNDMITVIGITNDGTSQTTFAAFYTTDDEPELIDIYYQDGFYSDVRITPNGYMFLTSSYSTRNFSELDDSSDLKGFIPACGFAESYDIVAPEDILLPEGGFGSASWLSYTVIGSIDLSEKGSPEAHDVKTLAGYAGSIYCSADNLYTASSVKMNTTDITRISINDGDIIPQAGCTINGTVKDQFSMSEYNGYFRVAATYIEAKETFHKYSDDENIFEGIWDSITGNDGYYTYDYIGQDTRVYVLDMDLNMVGYAEGLGEGEELKSASFSGNLAFIVTFRQTDPLYAVDLSDPKAPVVLDEFKINGFSTYMQQWGDGLLFGFGQDADENGRVTGIRMTMFDNSDPNELKAQDVFKWNSTQYDDMHSIEGKTFNNYSSIGIWDRKALLIAPEKNLIGIPVSCSSTTYSTDYYETSDFSSENTCQYVFFSYEDGKFVQKGDISTTVNDLYSYSTNAEFNRALYIGNYVYTVSSKKFVAADIDTLEITDELIFK